MPLRRWRQHPAYSRIWAFFGVLGPGLIAANADNDASGIYGYSLAGYRLPSRLLWVLVLSTLLLAWRRRSAPAWRLVTGRAADLIRERYGVKITLFAMLALLVANFATTVSEFAGILAAVQSSRGHGSGSLSSRASAIGIWLLVSRGSYRRLERILLLASCVYLAYIGSAFLAHPPWLKVVKETVLPDLKRVFPLQAYLFMVINVVGTTITPWGQFYIQSSVRDKGIDAKE